MRNEKLEMKQLFGDWLLVIGDWAKRSFSKKSVLTLFMLPFTLFTLLNAAGVEAVLSQDEVVLGNPVQLKITAQGDRVQFPQIDTIDGVPVEGRSQAQHTSLQIINGKSTVAHTTDLILTFTPKKDMDIPSLRVTIDGQTYQTKPKHLRVVKSTAPNSVNSGMFSLSMKADKHTVTVGEPLLVTVYFSLRHDVRLSDNPQYNRPEFKGFFVKEIGDEKSYNRGNYRITELRYVLTPQKEGNYTIAPASAKIGVADTSRRDIFGRYFGTIWKPISSNALEIEVKPLPVDADIVGRFTVESTVDATAVKANKPVNLTVTIDGEGSLDDFDLSDYEIDGVTIYSDDAEVTTNVIGNKLRSTYVKKFVFISDHDFKIPARTVTAYDPQSKKVQTLQIPGYSISVKSKPAAAGTTPMSKTNEAHSGEVQTNLKLSEKRGEAPTATSRKSEGGIAWWIAVAAFLAGMVTMYLAAQFKWKRKASPFKESEALKILYGHMSEDPEVEAMVRKLYAKKNGDKSVIIDKKELRALVEKYA
jgi:hypothetical protein